MVNVQKHKFILVNILKDIYGDTSLNSFLGFKGGTAAYLFYGLHRFSVDLDFNLLNPDKKDFVFEKLKNILKKYGKLKEARGKRFTIFFLLSYGEKEQNIKIEVSKKEFPNHYEVKNYLGISMLVMKKEDMLAHKLVALLERKNLASRDLFDLWYFMKNDWEINEKLVELRTNTPIKDYLRKCIEVVKSFNEKYILQGIGELLEKNQKDWTKGNLKKDVLFLLNFYSEKI